MTREGVTRVRKVSEKVTMTSEKGDEDEIGG